MVFLAQFIGCAIASFIREPQTGQIEEVEGEAADQHESGVCDVMYHIGVTPAMGNVVSNEKRGKKLKRDGERRGQNRPPLTRAGCRS
jgi:hypothetical protein